MKSSPATCPPPTGEKTAACELLILSDGRVLTHNLTPAVAAVLQKLAPDNRDLPQRASNRNTVVSLERQKP